jgi:hypothetical protein
VIIDSDVAELYGVTTKQVNQAVNRNPDKFPEGKGICMHLKNMRKMNWSQIVTGSKN